MNPIGHATLASGGAHSLSPARPREDNSEPTEQMLASRDKLPSAPHRHSPVFSSRPMEALSRPSHAINQLFDVAANEVKVIKRYSESPNT